MPEMADVCRNCQHTYREHCVAQSDGRIIPAMSGCLRPHTEPNSDSLYCSCREFQETTGDTHHFGVAVQDDIVLSGNRTATGLGAIATTQAADRAIRRTWQDYQQVRNYTVQGSSSDRELFDYARRDLEFTQTLAQQMAAEQLAQRLAEVQLDLIRRESAQEYISRRTGLNTDISIGSVSIARLVADYGEQIRQQTIEELKRTVIESNMKATTFSQQIEGRKFRVPDTTLDTVPEPRTDDNTGELRGQ